MGTRTLRARTAVRVRIRVLLDTGDTVTFDHLDLFSYIGGFSGASGLLMMNADKPDMKTAFHGALADPTAFSKRVHLLWIGVGTEEPRLEAECYSEDARHGVSYAPGTTEVCAQCIAKLWKPTNGGGHKSGAASWRAGCPSAQ